MKKKITSIILVIAMMITMVPFSSYADDFTKDPWDELDDTISIVADAAQKELGDAGDFASKFKSFMNVASGIGTGFAVINGGVTFLKLIGVIDDPIESGIGNILDKLGTMSERMEQMDQKLDDLAEQMTQMQATEEMHYRGEKASDLQEIWSTFSYDYMESGMDEFMGTFDFMIRDGVNKWCTDEADREKVSGKVDNSILMVTYAEGKDGYQQVFTRENTVPEECMDKYIILKNDMVPAPEDVAWDKNNYREKISEAVLAKLRSAAETGDFENIEQEGFPIFTKDGSEPADEELKAIADDAADSLIYRISCAQIDNNPEFAGKVVRLFNNFCRELMASGRGLDANLKTYFLTHAFEFEIKDELDEFCNIMVLKAGTYGVFTANIMGMSELVTDQEKLDTMDNFTKAVKDIDDARKTSITGYDNYSYITNTRLYYTEIEFINDFRAKTTEWENIFAKYQRYESMTVKPIRNSIKDKGLTDYSVTGDMNGLLLMYTLQNNGLGEDLDGFLKSKIAIDKEVRNYGRIVTSYGSPQTLPIDGKTTFRSMRIIGKWFSDSDRVKLDELNSDVSDGYFVSRQEVCGSYIDTDERGIKKNQTLLAVAAYGEGHSYWQKDEVAYFAGPSRDDWRDFETGMIISKSGDSYEYIGDAISRDNIIISQKIPKLSSSVTYDALSSYESLSGELSKDYPGDGGHHTGLIPEIDDVYDMGLDSLVWNKDKSSETKINEGCISEIERAALEAGLKEVPLSKKKLEKLASKMASMCEKEMEKVTSDTKLYIEDPFGFEGDEKKMNELAKEVLPEYMLNSNGSTKSSIINLFTRVQYCPFVKVTFEKRNKGYEPVLEMGYEVKPYLIVGEMTRGAYESHSFEIKQEVIEKLGHSFEFRLPAAKGKKKAVVHEYDNGISMNEISKVSKNVENMDGIRFMAMSSDGSATIFVAEYSKDNGNMVTAKSPKTGDDTNLFMYLLIMFVCFAGAVICLVLRRKEL